MKNFVFALIQAFSCLILIIPTAFAACYPEDDGDCCSKDEDCIAWVNPALCAILPLSKVAAKKLDGEETKISGGCPENSLRELREKAKTYIPACIDDACDFKVQIAE